MEHKLKIGITHGDINGVGYEVILKTLSDPRIVELCTPVVYGSSKVAAYHRKALDLPPFNFNIITSAEQCAAGKINMINCFDDELKVELSKPEKPPFSPSKPRQPTCKPGLSTLSLQHRSTNTPYSRTNSTSRDIPNTLKRKPETARSRS